MKLSDPNIEINSSTAIPMYFFGILFLYLCKNVNFFDVKSTTLTKENVTGSSHHWETVDCAKIFRHLRSTFHLTLFFNETTFVTTISQHSKVCEDVITSGFDFVFRIRIYYDYRV
ncbi:unnamed protein product [Amoebophrya sp. A120]|nr:unnamed protein product [Amoebophrya sp. A120]|eukprot:GSA120T00000974001.1